MSGTKPDSWRAIFLAIAFCGPTGSVVAAEGDDEQYPPNISGKLLLTGGVTQIEGSAGGGLVPWAVIGGYGTGNQFGGNAFFTQVSTGDYRLDDVGVLVGLHNRIELSFAQQRFNTQDVGALLGLGRGFTFRQDIIGLKVRLAGEAVLDSDRGMPQLSIGIQHKKNNQGPVLDFIGARDDAGTDFYIAATKLFLANSALVNGTLRYTRANQTGILGFGGDRDNGYQPQFEVSAAYLLTRKLAVGGEYRSKPDNLSIAHEQDWWDVFVAWAPNKHLSVTVAYADLGNIVIKDNQRGLYASVQVGF